MVQRTHLWNWDGERALISITARRFWNDLPPELRTIALLPLPPLPVTRHYLPPPLSITPGPSTQIKMSSLQTFLP